MTNIARSGRGANGVGKHAKPLLAWVSGRLAVAAGVILMMAVGTAGDVADNIAPRVAVASKDAGTGFSYGDWLQKQKAGFAAANTKADASAGGTNPIDGIDGVDGINTGLGLSNNNDSFGNAGDVDNVNFDAGDIIGRISDNALSRVRGSVLGLLPGEDEVRDLLVRYGNGDNISIGEWREIRFAGLSGSLRSLPLALYADGEDAIASALSAAAVERFSFVRRARIDLQTSLGGRSGQLGADVGGAVRESDDDIIGWQLRAFGGADDGKGGNAGLYYRRILGGVWGDTLAGVNVFADYEDDDADGEFWRWSLGGEVKSRYGEISANHYFVLTDPRAFADGSHAYSRGGYDAELAMRIPHAEWLRAHLAYYNFKGEFGDDDDRGLRLGLDFEPGGGLVVGMEYDNNSGDFGGNIAYSHRFGDPLPSASGTGEFSARAHFYDPVRREYSQRITRTDSVPSSSFDLSVSRLSVFVDVPAVAGASPLLGFTATITPGPPFAVSGIRGDVDNNDLIRLTGLDRYRLTPDRPLTLATESSADNNAAAVFNHLFGDWVMTLRGDSKVMLDNNSVLSVSGGNGVFERFRTRAISAVISDRATIRLAAADANATTNIATARIAFTTILADNRVLFNIRAGTATIEAMQRGSVVIQNGAAAILPIAGDGYTIISCANVPANISHIRFACEAENAAPVAVVGDSDRVIIPAELDASTLVATLINLGDAHRHYSFNVISGGELLAISRSPDNDGIFELWIRENPPQGDADLVIGIRDEGGDADNETRRTVQVRVLQSLSQATTPSRVRRL